MTTIPEANEKPQLLFTFLWRPGEGRQSKTIPDKYRSPKWFDRENMPYKVDYILRNQYAEWVWMIDWQLICTLTFPSRVSDDRAREVFAVFIDSLERTLHSDVAHVYGAEKRFAGRGKPACGRHFHVLLTSVAPMHPAFVRWLWNNMVGTDDDDVSARTDDDDASAKVEHYCRNQFGVRYVLKSLTEPLGDWGFRNLHLFHPEARNLQDLTRQQKRHLRRHKIRLKKLG
jgi:hypothetical protein